MAPSSSSSSLEVGQVVWVTVGEKHEEPALILKTKCTFEHSPTNDSTTTDAATEDGVLVQLSVSMMRVIYPLSSIRRMEDDDDVDCRNDIMKSRRSRRQASKSSQQTTTMKATTSTCRPSITPSPPASRSASTTNTAAEEDEEEEQSVLEFDDDDDPPLSSFSKLRKRHTTTTKSKSRVPKSAVAVSLEPALDASSTPKPQKKASAPSKKNEVIVVESSSSSGSSDAEEKKGKDKKTTTKSKASAAAASTKAKARVETKAKAKPMKKPQQVIEVNSETDEGSESEASNDNGNDTNVDCSNDDDDDRPFTIEASPTGRATCRRCDRLIGKGSMRISHVPLFRGKQGYTVYRHLECTIFSEEVLCVQDVAGWKKLDKGTLEHLRCRILASKKELEEENREIQPDELVPLAFEGPMRPSPPGLTVPLLPFQVEGVSWMYQQEKTLGFGILADEMGMGKTVQTITTILDNRPKLQHARPGAKHPPSAPDLEERRQEEEKWQAAAHEWRHEMEMNNVSPKIWPKAGMMGVRAGTLVVCPVIALSQWKAEIEKFTENNALTVGVYHGPDREKEMPRAVMCKYDVVLTTYQVLEQDFRKMVSPNKVTCPNCGAKFKIDKLSVHLKYFCGEGAQRTEAQMRQRRTAQHPGRGTDNGGGTGGKKGGDSKKPPLKSETKTEGKKGGSSKKPLVKTTSKHAKPRSKKPKKKIRLEKMDGYDSDSDLSVEADSDEPAASRTARPSRSSAVKASKRLSASVNEWTGGGLAASGKRSRNYDDDDDDDESCYSSGDESSDADSDVSLTSSLYATKKQNPTPKVAVKKRTHSEVDSDDDSDEEEDAALARAREKQRQALEGARMGKKSASKKNPSKGGTSKGKGKETKKRKGKGTSKGKGKKKKFDDETSDDSSANESDGDPLSGIDMNKLTGQAMAGARFSVLHAFSWWRVVLDEAHFIKSRSSQTAAAAFALTSVHRWCLSGTPLQNRVSELYSLIRFLRLDPMAHYFCRQCDCKSIHYRMKQGTCQDCGHRAFSHFSHFNKHVLNPIQRDGYTGDGRRAMFTLKSEVLDKCLLRRTKENRAEDMNLPPRLVSIRPVRLHPVEEDFYNALYTQTKSSFDDYVAEGTLLNNYAHIFDLLTKMRQAVNHPYLIVYSSSAKVRAGLQQQHSSAPVANGSVDCDMCHEPPTDRVVSSCCGAGFCRGCVIEYLTGAVGENTPCPSCDRPFTIDLNQDSVDVVSPDDGTLTVPSLVSNRGVAGSGSSTIPSLKELPHVSTGSILRRINLAEFATSTKIEVLIQELIEMRKKRPGSKVLVFSQFVNMLDLVRWRLHSDPCLVGLGLGVRILHGGMDVKSRDATLKDFREDPNCRVLLMSLKAAGVALNLTVASECFLLDLWWNPAAEMQAIDRTHRLGQYRPIRAVRFVAEGTVEERVLQLQEKKRLVFDGTIGRDAGSLKMLTVEDMMQLFA